MKIVIFGILFSILFSCQKQTEEKRLSNVDDSVKVKAIDTLSIIKALIKPNYPNEELYKIFKGDLNLDDTEDMIVVTETQCDSTNGLENSFCRKVFLLTKMNQKYSIASVNTNIIDCDKCGGAGVGDGFSDIVITEGSIKFEFLYGACDKTAITDIFKYDPKIKNWLLYEETVNNYSCHATEKGEIPQEIKTTSQKDLGKITFSNFGKAL
jgi:hypothetical protein